MTFHWTPLLTLLSLPILAPAAEDPVVVVDAALKRLHASDSYAWETTFEPCQIATHFTAIDVPDEMGRQGASIPTNIKWISAVIKGATDRKLGTTIEAPVTRFLDSRAAVHVVTQHGRSVADVLESWLTPGKMEERFAALPPRSPLGANASLFELKMGFWSVLHTARVLFALRTPAEELDFLLLGSHPPMQMGPTLVATLREETAKKILFELRDRHGPGAPQVPPLQASGSVTLWLKNGEIAKYEVAIRGTFPERESVLKKTTTLLKFDRANVRIPRAALQAIEQTAGSN